MMPIWEIVLLPMLFIAGWFLRGAVSYRHYITPIVKRSAAHGRYEFLRESGNKFVPTGEIIPEGDDPHDAVEKRSRVEGISYGARAVL